MKTQGILDIVRRVRDMGFRLEGAAAWDKAIDYWRVGITRLAWRVRYGEVTLYLVIYRRDAAHEVLIWVYTEEAWTARGIGPFMSINPDGSIEYTYDCIL